MALDLELLASKLRRYREQFQAAISEVSSATGISEDSLSAFENAKKQPTGDEILILADFYKSDYRFFISGEQLAPFEQTETLFRKHGEQLSRKDRWAIQEFLYLCECEEFLMNTSTGTLVQKVLCVPFPPSVPTLFRPLPVSAQRVLT